MIFGGIAMFDLWLHKRLPERFQHLWPWLLLTLLLLIVILLFFPWLSLSAGNRTILRQSGFDVAFSGVGREYAHHPELEGRLQEFFSIDPELKPARAWLLILYVMIIAVGLLAAMGAVVAADRLPAWTATLLLGLMLGGLLLLLLERLTGFPLANQFETQVAQDQAALQTRSGHPDIAEHQARRDWVEIQGGVKRSLVRYRPAFLFVLLLNGLACTLAIGNCRHPQLNANPHQ
jgi:hypothetical protein